MRRALLLPVLLTACVDTSSPPPVARAVATPASGQAAPAAAPAPPSDPLSGDTPESTTHGATFVAPAGFRLSVRGEATILQAPESDSRIAIVDTRGGDAEAALAAAWKAYDPDARRPVKVVTPQPDRDGWSEIRTYAYQTSPSEQRDVEAEVRRAGEVWTTVIRDMSLAVLEKRYAAVALVYQRLWPRGYQRESFAGKRANPLDAARIAVLTSWVEGAMKALGVPGAAVGLVQDGKVVLARGFGVRELGREEKVDQDTLFMIGSNTKSLTTLMLAKLVDEKKLTWETPVTQVLPSFALGDADTTRQVLVKHLVCACTGLPRQDLEWIFEFEKLTPEKVVARLAAMQPTSKFGEIFQYSNVLASAGGYVGGHVLSPKLELGAAYDDAMRTRVFQPLGMMATTFDLARALRGNRAYSHAPDIDGKASRAAIDVDSSVFPVRPAGAAWSNVRDMLRYVAMELAEGALPGGKPYIGKDALLERRKPQVPVGSDETYGMGLAVSTQYGMPVVHHGGATTGFHSDVIWLPEHHVGAVILTNSDAGLVLRSVFERKLLEVLFDGKPDADAELAAQTAALFAQLAAERSLLTVPADPAESAKLAARYTNAALGDILVTRSGSATTFDFGEWKSTVATRKNPDGTLSFLTTSPGVVGFELLVATSPKRTLTTHDAQHEHTFTER